MPVPVISIAQMREWEGATWKTGQTEVEVIRRVGKQLVLAAVRLTRPGELIVVLSGRGSNGADARAMLEVLDERRMDTLEIRDPEVELGELETLLALQPALVVDGLFGIGINRPLNDAWVRVIERINAARLQVLSVDVPSGLDADTGKPMGASIEASVTLTVGAPKIGMIESSAWRYVGRLEVANEVGLIPCPCSGDLTWTLPSDFKAYPPRRTVATHKGTWGHLAILAGSGGFHGAAVLAARGSQRAQPGLITLYPHGDAYLPAASQLQAVMVQPVIRETMLTGKHDAVLVGPGLASAAAKSDLSEAVGLLWSRAEIPVVVDASALQWLPRGPVPPNAIRVITPHPGEAARLLGSTTDDVQSNRPATLRKLSERYGDCWVVLKGHQTLVGRREGVIAINSSGNPHLAQGGAGDVLAGFIAGLVAQPPLREDIFRLLRLAVWQHGRAADRLQESGAGWVVEDLISHLIVSGSCG